MLNQPYEIIKLEKHETHNVDDKHINGTLTVIWRDWDEILNISPKMIYVTSVNPKEVKGPHIHKKRTSYFSCISGKVAFIIRDNDGNYHEIISSPEDPILLCVPNNIATAHINLSPLISSVLTIADISWRPNDNEMINVNFDNYDWTKWKKFQIE